MKTNKQGNDFLNPAKILGSMKRPAPQIDASSSLPPLVQQQQQYVEPNPKKARVLLARPSPQRQEPMWTPPKQPSKKKKDPPKSEDVINTAPAVAASPSDIYDAMMGEISDLLLAAQESQALGRIKMASTYQLLAHTRLVGLGKRFDGFLAHGHSILNNKSGGTVAGAERSLTFTPNGAGGVGGIRTGDSNSIVASASASSSANNVPVAVDDMREAQATLAKILPSEVDLDNTMMEHLARAAMELHNKRTGKGMLHEKHEARKTELEHARNIHMSGSASSSITPSANANVNARRNANANTCTSGSTNVTPNPNGAAGETAGGVAWTDLEKRKVLQAAEMYGAGNVEAIAAHVASRNVAEVRAHLLNMSQRGKVERQITGATVAVAAAPGESTGGKQNRNVGVDVVAVAADSEGDDSSMMPSPRKGRGKKPPSKAMLTVPNAVFDAKKMVGGKLL